MTQLLDYIVEQAKQIDPNAYNLAATSAYLKRPSDLRDLPGVSVNIQEQGDHLWLRVDRLEAFAAPAPPSQIATFVAPAQDPTGPAPHLLERVLVAHLEAMGDGEVVRARIGQLFDDFLRRWTLWAETEKPRRATIRIYGDLFALKHQLEAAETAAKPQELVWGIGVAVWRIPHEDKRVVFDYPLLTQAVEISIDPTSMSLAIRPRDIPPRVELDAIVACGVHGSSEAERAMRDHLERIGAISPFDASTYDAVLKLAASSLDSNGAYREIVACGEPVPPPCNSIIVSDAWVLFSRARSNNYLVEDIRRLRKRVEEGKPLPVGPEALVADPSDMVLEREEVRFRGLCGGGSGLAGSAPMRELYFPLPYNDEQVAIVRRLESSPGVAVQGPPGTGKTHTIANVICHYLATGRRVLVTSRGEPALEVLQEKIPEEVRSLTVSLLASDREGVRQFQGSISAIQHHVSQLDENATKAEIERHQAAIGRVHGELEELDRRVDVIAAQQLSEIVVDGTVYRAQKLAEMVVQSGAEHAWFDDTLTLAPEHAPPLSETEAANVREARRRLGNDLAYLGLRTPNVAELPTVEQLVHLHEGLVKLVDVDEQLAALPEFALRETTTEVLASAETFVKRLDVAASEVAELERHAPVWGSALRAKCREPSFASERQALEALFQDIETLTAERAAFLKRPVELSPDALADPRTAEAIERAAESGRPFGLMTFGVGEARTGVAAIRVAGLMPADASVWQHVLRYVRLNTRVLTFLARWNAFANELGLPVLEGDVTAIRKIEQVARAARRAHTLATSHDRVLVQQAQVLFVTPPVAPILGASEDLRRLAGAVRKHLTRAQLTRAGVARSQLDQRVASAQGPIADRIRQLVASRLGERLVSSAELSPEYAALLVEVHRVASLANDLALIGDAAERVRRAGAPAWSHRMMSIVHPPSGDDPVFPADWRRSWTWARMRGHLDAIEARAELRTLADRREELVRALEKLYRQTVGQCAWLATKKKAAPRVLQALAAYASAIGRIGMGTGPNATRHRRDAREAMLDAAGAVPCWIMSHARVSEAMPPDLGAFDLVIVDEASQSDLWALPALLRGKKVLVVGDDKQVSPDGAFINAQHIVALRQRFLYNQPYASSLTPEKSLYDIGARVYAGDQIMLLEHFRCVAPIIAYSNRQFYQDSILPLRTPKASERIDPPLVDIFVRGGHRDAHDTNHLEAEAIAEEVSAILEDPKLSRCTLGVVSLLGIEQAKHIDEVVRARCAPSELLRRRFECGDARTFQGSERDIMFLSMVADRENHRALSGNGPDQRFNVAASRARDRMYLVRSVEAAELSEVDLRRSLIEHFEKPMVSGGDAAADLSQLCESGFERDVFTMLTQKGYRTIPQVKVGSFRIDLVVEGAQDRRLAIELDGDDYHGPDRWAHDMARQRILERAGWTFWRCFASTWSLDREAIFDELRQRLDEMGIEAVGQLDRAPGLVERRIFERPSTFDAEDEVANLIERAASRAS